VKGLMFTQCLNSAVSLPPPAEVLSNNLHALSDRLTSYSLRNAAFCLVTEAFLLK